MKKTKLKLKKATTENKDIILNNKIYRYYAGKKQKLWICLSENEPSITEKQLMEIILKENKNIQTAFKIISKRKVI